MKQIMLYLNVRFSSYGRNYFLDVSAAPSSRMPPAVGGGFIPAPGVSGGTSSTAVMRQIAYALTLYDCVDGPGLVGPSSLSLSHHHPSSMFTADGRLSGMGMSFAPYVYR
jgi:hypothetical protein